MTIGFIHPHTNEYMEISAPLPEYFFENTKKFTLNSEKLF